MNGAVLKDIEVHLLQSRRDLLEETAELINRQWPKSMEHRYLTGSILEGNYLFTGVERHSELSPPRKECK